MTTLKADTNKHIFKYVDGDMGMVFDKDGKWINLPTLIVNTKTGHIVHHECDENGKPILDEARTGINQITVQYEPPLTFKVMTVEEINEWNWKRINE